MLQTIRERAQGWIAWAIVILISIPFALWGIQSYLGVGSAPVVATVNGVEITQQELDTRYQQTRMRLRERLGASYRPELFDERTMRAQVLERMIRDNLLLQASYDMGLRASDQELRMAILSNPAFQRDGRFDKATYERMLELQGTQPPRYEQDLRQSIVATQLARAMLASELTTEHELADWVRLDRQQRRVGYLRIPASGFANDEPFPEEEIEAYYRDNERRFEKPERVRLNYLVLDAEAIGASQNADEDELRRIYEEERDRFSEPEQRRARHILISLDADADADAEQEARTRIEEIRARILGGEDFAELAREMSDDPGSGPQGGDLGMFESGLMDASFDKAAFALAQDEISDPVRSPFGYHLIQVTEIQPERVQGFEEVRDQIASEIAKNRSEGLFYDWAERLANLSYENPDSLEPAAEVLGIELQTSDWMDRSGGEDLLASPKVVAAAFSSDVLEEGLNSDLIEPDPEALRAVVLRVEEHEEAAPRPLDEVRDEIVASLGEERAARAAKEAADEMVQSLEAGEEVAAATADYEIKDLGLIDRRAPGVSGAIRQLAFSLPRPPEGGASFGSEQLDNGDAVVVILSELVDGALDSLADAEREQARSQLEQELGNSHYEDLVSDLERRADIVRKPLEVETSY